MSDFSTAVTAVEMALKAFQLDEQVSVLVDSEAQTILLDDTVRISTGKGEADGLRSPLYAWVARGGRDAEVIVSTDDVVEAVVEAVSHLIAEQARDVLYSIFEAVGSKDDLG